MPTEIISTQDTEFDPELVALADEFDSLGADEQRIEAEGTKLIGYRTHIHVRQGRILIRARNLIDSDQLYGQWRSSRESLRAMSRSMANNLTAYVDRLPATPVDSSEEDTSKYPSEYMVRRLKHSDIPIEITRAAVENHINGTELLDYASVKVIRDRHIKPKPVKTISMADYATIEQRIAIEPHLTGEQLLGIGHGACADAITIVAKAFRQKYHPDKGGDEESYYRINAAAEEVLNNVR